MRPLTNTCTGTIIALEQLRRDVQKRELAADVGHGNVKKTPHRVPINTNDNQQYASRRNATNFGTCLGGSDHLETSFGVCACVKWLQHLLWQHKCLFGYGDLGNVPCMRRMFTKMMTFMPSGLLFDGMC